MNDHHPPPDDPFIDAADGVIDAYHNLYDRLDTLHLHLCRPDQPGTAPASTTPGDRDPITLLRDTVARYKLRIITQTDHITRLLQTAAARQRCPTPSRHGDQEATVLSVYCSGSIRKGPSDTGKQCWTEHERAEVARGATGRNIVFVNQDHPIADVGNTLGEFGRDIYQISLASAVIVDARQRRGLGVGVELAAAAALGTPVIVVAPPNTQYRCDQLTYRGAVVDNYIHPHIAALATTVVDDFTAAGAALTDLPPTSTIDPTPRPEPPWLSAAITEYVSKVLPIDDAMHKTLHRLHADQNHTDCWPLQETRQ